MILASHLHYNEKGIKRFIVALSEVCQNIIEHSENTGLVGIQKYHFHDGQGAKRGNPNLLISPVHK